MHVIITGYYGHNIREQVDSEHTWEQIERLYKAFCPPWHDGTLVQIHRTDNGCAYNAPGTFTVKDKEGNQTVVILEAS